MIIVDIEGADLRTLRNILRVLEDQFASDYVWKVAVAIDEDSFKLKVNEGVWTVPIGRLRGEDGAP